MAGILFGGGLAFADGDQATRISHFSGKPVPRFESLRFAAANGRMGPGKDHRILWRYEREGLPMLITKESHDWRRVRDPSGDEVWMHKHMLGGDPAAILRAETVLQRKPDALSKSIATLEQDVLVELGACENDWCRVMVGNKKGYVLKASLWGAESSDTPL